MPLVINSNYSATIASTNLGASNALLERSLTRLSSGSKIVNPSDDAGGMAVSMKVSAAARRMGSTSANISNSISFLQTQDGALSVLGKVLNRVSELKTLAVDPTKNSSDLANYESEFSALKSEINALAVEKFNGKALFSSTALDVATTADADSSIEMEGVDLLGSGAVTPIMMGFSDQNTYSFTAPEAGTMTVVSSNPMAYLDFTATNNSAIRVGQSATFDGINTWTLPPGQDTITGATVELKAYGNGSMVFTPSSGETNLGNVSSAGSLAGLELGTITSAIQEVSTHRAKNGSYQSRLNMAAELLTTNKANIELANSRITDVDVAEESTRLSRANVIVQAGTSMLTQANNSTQSMRTLLNL